MKIDFAFFLETAFSPVQSLMLLQANVLKEMLLLLCRHRGRHLPTPNCHRMLCLRVAISSVQRRQIFRLRVDQIANSLLPRPHSRSILHAIFDFLHVLYHLHQIRYFTTGLQAFGYVFANHTHVLLESFDSCLLQKHAAAVQQKHTFEDIFESLARIDIWFDWALCIFVSKMQDN